MKIMKTTPRLLRESKIYRKAVRHAAKHLAEQPQAVDLKTRLNAIMHKRGLNKIFNKLFPVK